MTFQGYLKADTEIKVVIGRVVAVGDGFTPVTTLALTTADEAEIMKHNAAAVTDISGNTFVAIANADGYYNLTITSGQLDTEGMLTVLINDDSLCRPIKASFMVRNANAYDSLDAAATTDYLQTDVVEISGDSVAADNLESQYDTSGLSGDTFPSTQAQVGNIAAGTAATNTVATGRTITAGTETNSYTDTEALDGTSHIISAVGGVTDFYYEFNVGENGVPTGIQWQGYANAQGDSYAISAWNWITSAWDQIGTKTGVPGTTIVSESYDLTTSHVGTGVNIGLVRARAYSTDGAAFGTDRLLCSFATVYQSVGYAEGAIWVDTVNGVAGTANYINGTADNPVLTWANAKTLSASVGIKKFHIVHGSSITMDTNCDDFTFLGAEYDIDLGGQSFENTHIEEANVTGIGTSGASGAHFKGCYVTAITAGKSHFENCGFSGTNIGTSASTYIFNKCYNSAEGSVPPILDFGGALGDTHAAFRNWQGGIEIKNLGQLGTDVFTITGAGSITIGATCIGGTIRIVGAFTITDNTAGGFLGGMADEARFDVDQINDECDTALSDYDGPTRAEATSDKDEIITEVNALNDITVADIIGGIADGTYDFQEMMRLIFSASCAKVSGGGTSSIVCRNGPDTKNRIITTVDTDGNRTAVTLDGT